MLSITLVALLLEFCLKPFCLDFESLSLGLDHEAWGLGLARLIFESKPVRKRLCGRIVKISALL